MTKIVPLSPGRVEAMRPLAREFYAEGNLPGQLDEDRFLESWHTFIANELGLVMAAWEGDELLGVIGGIKAPSVMTGELELVEQFWFMGKAARGKGVGGALLNAFETAALSEGAARVIMVHLCDEVGEKLARVYEARGFRPLEVHYMKEL